jgi:hypothetical protein
LLSPRRIASDDQLAPASVLRSAPASIPVGHTAQRTELELGASSPPRPLVHGLCSVEKV